ncbi:hypothetical protein LS73_003105 [Helicobacter muridarum]|nr:hypothetical protein LS73_003105 [Helicobacter muridarum]
MPLQIAFGAQDYKNNEYFIDKAHSSVSFGVKHLSVADSIGIFEDFDGRLFFENGVIKKLQGQAAINSINTFNPGRDSDLQDSNFFSHSKAFLESISFNDNVLLAKLTINNITKEVSFKASIIGPIRNPSLYKQKNKPQDVLKNPILDKDFTSNMQLQSSKNNSYIKQKLYSKTIDSTNNTLVNPMLEDAANSDCGCYASYGDNVLGIELFGKINRFDFNIASNTPKEWLGDIVWIKIILEASQ